MKKKLEINMNLAEHSRLIYLLDALRSAPEKAKFLLYKATSKKMSKSYIGFIDKISSVADDENELLKMCEKIREDIFKNFS